MVQDELVIHSGQVTTTIGGGRIGGVSSARPTGAEPAEVRLVVVEVDGAERYEQLRVDDTFAVDGATWRLMDIRYFSAGQWEVVAVPTDTASIVNDSEDA
ncbi:hypothetical protein IHE56_15580 [Streptomyces sp. ID01-12c]|uniref:DUF6406 domain-containing protein n=1 Tax=Streptomyces caniscabiei TaxID=2746961 RepID=UPI00177AFF19|nr:DUF6406 domain-containing protein [Streptomyces caniscabiei]MBD9703478.1 hypothetical protein [Streptomyces caniscabiei]MDX3726733.1 hypothetical protein [Streptomyces caniscabiei]